MVTSFLCGLLAWTVASGEWAAHLFGSASRRLRCDARLPQL